VEVCRYRGMGVNVNKSKIMVVKRGDTVSEIRINREMLELVNELKYLGCVR